MLDLDESVWSLSSTVFNPPRLSGVVSYLTALEAMISHSDNTATDMAINHVGVETIRDFIVSIGLHGTRIPNSTRQYLAYIFGCPAGRRPRGTSSSPRPDPTLRWRTRWSTPCRWSRPRTISSPSTRGALQGEFFQHPQTLTESVTS